MVSLIRVFIIEVQKTQTRCGSWLFVISLLFWAIMLAYLSGYVFNIDDDNFDCKTTKNIHPTNNSRRNAECYREYSEEYNTPINLSTFAVINGSVLLLAWALYLVCAFGKLPHDSHEDENPRRPDPKLFRPCVLQLTFRTLYLVVMMGALLGLFPFDFPGTFNCSLNGTDYKCWDEFGDDKTNSRKVILVYDGLFGLFAFWELFYVLCR